MPIRKIIEWRCQAVFDEMISWGELIVLVLFVLGSVLMTYLILAVSNLLRILKNVNQLLEKNKGNIDRSIEKLPEITDNTAKITKTVNESLDGLGKIVTDVGKVTETVKKSAETIQKDIILKAKSIVDIVDAIKRFFEKKKSKPKTSKKSSTVYKYKYKDGQDKPEEIEVIRAIDEPDGIITDEYERVENESPANDEILVAQDEAIIEEDEETAGEDGK
jgi:phage-related tail protein